MTIVKKERKGKGLLYLIAIVGLISLALTACKNKPTAMSDFVFEESLPVVTPDADAPIDDGQTSTDPTKPGENPDDNGNLSGDSSTGGSSSGSGSTVAFKDCMALQGLYNNGYTYYESSERQGNFKYTLTIKDGMKVVLGKTTGETIREYTLSAGGNKKYISYQEGAELQFGAVNNIEDRHISFKPTKDNSFIDFSLQKQ